MPHWTYQEWIDFIIWYSGMKEKSVLQGVEQYLYLKINKEL